MMESIQVTAWSPHGNTRTVHVRRSASRPSLLDLYGGGRVPLRWRLASAMARIPDYVATLTRNLTRGLRPLPTALAR